MVPIFINLTSERVQHYDGVIEMMVSCELARFQKEHKRLPTQSQIDFYKKELHRLMTIGRRIDDAQKVRIPEHNILKG